MLVDVIQIIIFSYLEEIWGDGTENLIVYR